MAALFLLKTHRKFMAKTSPAVFKVKNTCYKKINKVTCINLCFGRRCNYGRRLYV